MKTMTAATLAACAILVFGGARVALAQVQFFDNLSAAVDWTQFDPALVPDAVERLVTVIRPATKQCPPTSTNTPTLILDATGPVPTAWPIGFTFNQSGFVCLLDGSQCGFTGGTPITATSSRVTVDSSGIITLRCSVNVK